MGDPKNDETVIKPQDIHATAAEGGEQPAEEKLKAQGDIHATGGEATTLGDIHATSEPEKPKKS
ncbi:hypothetical protein [Streptomyces tsukubensis]|uniref:Uncharacterized protein n=1 Tax=Streptomyces tsukubensis TaxID=83656 RepID=A0A1V4A0U2_9ACTN|nr:hypothetical protein [Streptomyces tsukubensis]OON72226.1 hypothetical protein B1H18_30385 [Streptomyces tsukubensis]QFR94122.1 hypothetical protein GBW32_15020 [Streptomyces tsukubensis]